MKNYKFTISFLGTNYSGWQYQPNVPTIQGEVEEKLSYIVNKKKPIKQKIRAIGCSRTDKGVHAVEFVFNVKMDYDKDLSFLKRALNSALPKDIKVHNIEEVPLVFNARFDAFKKTYMYKLFFDEKNSPFLQDRAMLVYKPTDLEKFISIGSMFLGYQDFRGFAKEPEDDNTFCFVEHINVKIDYPLVEISITANRFLRYMVRRIVGTMLSYAQGDISIDDINDFLKAKKISNYTAKAHGLYLKKVYYDGDR
ncbi:tRNA pseudouridine(38-40) synthase TruA [Hydrogenobaculum acidophilum]